jgi:hypothetical protein
MSDKGESGGGDMYRHALFAFVASEILPFLISCDGSNGLKEVKPTVFNVEL